MPENGIHYILYQHYFDKNWKQTIENYTLVDDEHFDVLTTYHKNGRPEESFVRSKLFFDEHKSRWRHESAIYLAIQGGILGG
jgi:hypothetical protein